MIRQAWLALLLLGLTSCSGGAMKFPDGNLRFLALGDSYTIGESVGEPDRWPVQLSRRLKSRGFAIGELEIIAVTGWTTDELAKAINEAGPRGPYDLVSLLIGVNNQYRGRTAESFRPEFADLLRRAIDFAGGNSAKVFVVSIPDWGVMPFAADRDRQKIASEIDSFNSVCKEEAGKRGVLFVDVTGISRQATTQPALVAEDGLHPSAEQYRLWAERIDNALTIEALKIVKR